MNFFSLFKRKLIYKLKKKINIDTDGVIEQDLDKLLFHYGSDKSNFIKNQNTRGHGYSKFYSKYFEKFKSKKINILEIGSYSGASAAAFNKFFENSQIICFDINISKFIYNSKNIKVFGLDIKDYNKVKKILNRINEENHFDLIIDDGSHNLEDILLAFKNMFKHVKKGGLYVIEDYKFPNYYSYNKNIDDILVDNMLKNIVSKKFFDSKIFDKQTQSYFHENIDNIFFHKGNFEHSDICFISK